MPGCPYFIGNTFIHLFAGLILTGLSAENPIAGDLSQKPLTHILFSIVLLALLFITMSVSVGPLKYALFVALCFLLGQNLSGLEQRLKQKQVLSSVLFYTGAVFVTMVGLGLYDSQNMLGWGLYLSSALVALIIAMLFSALFIENPEERSSINMWLSRFSVLLFTFFIAFDVEVLKENAKACKGEPDYINESMGLYLDIINLFTGFGSSNN